MGCDACQQQCNLQLDKGNAGWWYMPAKNKQRLRAKKERRKASKASLRDKRKVGGERGIIGNQGA
jgi:hypothetical protein